MAKPILKFPGTNHDYTQYLAEEGLKPSREDLDAAGAGRNITDGTMVRNRIATKMKWTVSFNRLPASVLKELEIDLYKTANFVQITMINPYTNASGTKWYYCSTITEGVQRYLNGNIFYDGVTFNLIEK